MQRSFIRSRLMGDENSEPYSVSPPNTPLRSMSHFLIALDKCHYFGMPVTRSWPRPRSLNARVFGRVPHVLYKVPLTTSSSNGSKKCPTVKRRFFFYRYFFIIVMPSITLEVLLAKISHSFGFSHVTSSRRFYRVE